MSERSAPAPARGVVVGHGEMARGLVSAVRGIAGDVADTLLAISNEGKSPETLRAELQKELNPEVYNSVQNLRKQNSFLK